MKIYSRKYYGRELCRNNQVHQWIKDVGGEEVPPRAEPNDTRHDSVGTWQHLSRYLDKSDD
jgi:hypothetical protein